MPTLNELAELIETRSSGIEWLNYMHAHQEVKGYFPLPQLKTQIKFCDPKDVVATMRNLHISYSALESTQPSFLVRSKKQKDLKILGNILETFQSALQAIEQNPESYPKWRGYI